MAANYKGDDTERGSGRTTKLLQMAAQEGAIFGVHNRGMKEHADYLCQKHSIRGVNVLVINDNSISSLRGISRPIRLDHEALAKLPMDILRAIAQSNSKLENA